MLILFTVIQMTTSYFTQSTFMYEVKVKRAQLGSSVMKNREIIGRDCLHAANWVNGILKLQSFLSAFPLTPIFLLMVSVVFKIYVHMYIFWLLISKKRTQKTIIPTNIRPFLFSQLLENSQLTLMEEWRGWCATFTI